MTDIFLLNIGVSFLVITYWFVMSNDVYFWQSFFYFFIGLTFLLPINNLLLFSIDVSFYKSLIYFFLALMLCLEMTDYFVLSSH